ncbi:hypothetical protein CSA37_04700 [Candidatus Fermentibacteria bacterium]|nr:MAG: hypothetical protein CSA37_04700 [Candidatus Fermentibacteria bacterium]
MVKFPAALETLGDLEVLFRRAVSRSATGRAAVRVPQLPRLRNIIADISRTPAGERVNGIFRQVNLWTEDSVSSTILPAAGAAGLLAACAGEASALLELGYGREDGIDFITSFALPFQNPVRTLNQIRSAIHYTGGNFALLTDMLERENPSSRHLKLVFSVWPVGGRIPAAWRPGEDLECLHLDVSEASVPLVITFSRALRGYALLSLWDLASSLAEERSSVQLLKPSFRYFALDS